MHRCLRIVEILEHVAENIEVTADHLTMLNMALTCQVFYEPAINVLWRSLPDLEPIGNLLAIYYYSEDIDQFRVSSHDESKYFCAHILTEYRAKKKPSVGRDPKLYAAGPRVGDWPRDHTQVMQSGR